MGHTISGINWVRKSGDPLGAAQLALQWALGARRPVRISIGAQELAIRPRTPDLDVAKSTFSGEFDAAIRAAMPLRHKFIVDAGAYIGTSAIALATAFPEARIVALEPSRQNFALLKQNTARYPNVIALNKALGAREGAMMLQDFGSGEWGFSIVPAPAGCADPAPLHEVEVTTLPAIMAAHGADGIDLLKLDIEGSEHQLLSGDTGWVAATRVILAELHDRIVPGCEAAFDAATTGRLNSRDGGEKVMSIAAS